MLNPCSILKDHTNEKYKVLNRANKTVAAKLMSLKPQEKINELLELLGYVVIDEGQSAFVSDNYTVLMSGNKLIETAIEDI